MTRQYDPDNPHPPKSFAADSWELARAFERLGEAAHAALGADVKRLQRFLRSVRRRG